MTMLKFAALFKHNLHRNSLTSIGSVHQHHSLHQTGNPTFWLDSIIRVDLEPLPKGLSHMTYDNVCTPSSGDHPNHLWMLQKAQGSRPIQHYFAKQIALTMLTTVASSRFPLEKRYSYEFLLFDWCSFKEKQNTKQHGFLLGSSIPGSFGRALQRHQKRNLPYDSTDDMWTSKRAAQTTCGLPNEHAQYNSYYMALRELTKKHQIDLGRQIRRTINYQLLKDTCP